MDEIVFTRETLRRSLLEASDALEKAADAYDPSDDVHMEDIVAVATMIGIGAQLRKFTEAVTHQMKARKGGEA